MVVDSFVARRRYQGFLQLRADDFFGWYQTGLIPSQRKIGVVLGRNRGILSGLDHFFVRFQVQEHVPYLQTESLGEQHLLFLQLVDPRAHLSDLLASEEAIEYRDFNSEVNRPAIPILWGREATVVAVPHAMKLAFEPYFWVIPAGCCHTFAFKRKQTGVDFGPVRVELVGSRDQLIQIPAVRGERHR